MVKKLQYKGMIFKRNSNGTYTVSSDKGKYFDDFIHFKDATMWICNMADNHDIADDFCHRICDAFECDVYGHKSDRTMEGR